MRLHDFCLSKFFQSLQWYLLIDMQTISRRPALRLVLKSERPHPRKNKNLPAPLAIFPSAFVRNAPAVHAKAKCMCMGINGKWRRNQINESLLVSFVIRLLTKRRWCLWLLSRLWLTKRRRLRLLFVSRHKITVVLAETMTRRRRRRAWCSISSLDIQKRNGKLNFQNFKSLKYIIIW